jgi:FHS family L-fucose permease-like MFS transporter
LVFNAQRVAGSGTENELRSVTDGRAMTVAMILFFMVGFLTCLNDIIIPHLKSIFELNYMQAMLVQFAFFSSYFVFSYPGGRCVDWLGYKKTMVLGLMTMAAGAAGFIPASYVASFPVFLGALILLAAGMTTVQVAANPYVTIIGPSSTASSRLNLAQAFNSVGTFIAPFVGGLLILRGAPQITSTVLHSMNSVAHQSYRQAQASSVRLPYAGMALLLALLATALGLLRLGRPSSGRTQPVHHSREGVLTQITRQEIWHHPWLLCGALGIFTYVGAEVTIGSLLVNYMGLPQVAGLREQTAANYLMFYWGGAMIGRFIGSAILQRVNTGLLLCVFAVGASVLVLTSILSSGRLAMDAMLGVGFFNSIMFPSIFTLGIQDLGPLTSKGSSLMIASIVGGALVPLATGRLADRIGLQPSFIVTVICYAYIALFAAAAIRRRVLIQVPPEIPPA